MSLTIFTLEYERTMLEKEDIPKPAKKAIMDFVDGDLVLEGISERRRKDYLQRLRVVARWIPQSFLNPTKNDLREVVKRLSGKIERVDRKTGELHLSDKYYSDNTRATYLKMLKKFYRKKLSRTKFENLFADVKVKAPRSKVLESDLITPEEIILIIDNSKNARDKALFATLYDSGCRVGEILLMRIKSLRFDNYGAVLEVPLETKTGTRPVRVVGNSVPYLRAWLDNHPKQNDPEAPLFCNLVDTIRGRALTYDDVHKALRKTLKRAGITKRIYPHLFRHTRASILASKIPESPLEDQMGWVHGSKQTATYVHLKKSQVDEAVLKGYGVEIENEAIPELKPAVCPRCGEPNATNALRCRKCWLPLDMKEITDQEEKLDQLVEEYSSAPSTDPAVKMLLGSLQTRDAKIEVINALQDLILKNKRENSNY